jgi:NAD(P)-dependent dehydrogenase (short-subunit alcohol dehydrogenase family)
MSIEGLRDLLDDVADALIVPSFTRLGYEARRRAYGWTPPAEHALAGRTTVVTGATSGLGEVTATALARLGARVVLVARSRQRAEATRDRIAGATGSDDLAIELADLEDLCAVRRAAEAIAAREARVDVLIHNAGALLTERRTSPDGYESTFATMVLAPALLTDRLLPALRSARGRIVVVTSGGMYAQRLHLDDLQSTHDPYRGSVAYARAKRAQVALMRLWARELRGTVTVHAMHPGWADTPGVEASLPRFRALLGPLLRSPEEGADTIVWLAAADEPARTSGRLWLDRRPRAFDKLPGTAVSHADAVALRDACERLIDDALARCD